MAKEKKSFSELLSEAPMATQEDTVTLVGALGRSSQSGKFVLALGPGSSVTLEVDAVKGYQVLGGGVGQLLVQVELDRERVPDSIAQPQAAAGPFALATPHHAPPGVVAGPQAWPVTHHAHDATNPIVDSGATGRFPYFD